MKICIIGAGYVGLTTGTCFADLGNTVYCVDNDHKKINSLKKGIIPIYEPGLDELIKKNFIFSRLKFTTDIKKATLNSNIIFICVGTPINKKNNSANLMHVFHVAKQIKKYINRYKIIITKSTVPISTGDKLEKIFKNKLTDVISNPEFLREGEAIRDFIYPDRIVVGTSSNKANKIIRNLYEPIVNKGAKYINTSRRGAELIKYASNAFLATKITYINEIANLCEKAKVNVEDVSIGMGSDQRIGSRFLRVGPAYGGSCFPKDTKAIVNTADKYKVNLSLIKSVIKSNQNRRKIITKKIFNIMKNKIKNKIITFLGVTFKPNTDDMRESACLYMIPAILKKGAIIHYYDPSGKKEEFKKYRKVKYFNNIKNSCQNSDLIIIHTEWNEFKTLNFNNISKKKNFSIYDMRNIYSPNKMKKKGINYFGIGR